MVWPITLASSAHTAHATANSAESLALSGVFCVFMAAVVGFRSLMAEDAGLPIPDPPHTDLPGRVAKKMATNERAAALFYRAVAWTALFIGVGLLLASFVAWLFV